MAEFPTLADIFEPIEGKTGTEANEQMRLWYTGTRQLPGGAPSAAISIIDDVIAPTSADVIVDTEGQAPADDLQIIKTDSTHDGMIVSLRAANPDRAVTVLATGQLNGITLWNRAAQYVLSTDERLMLQRDGNVWREIRGIAVSAMHVGAELDHPGTTPPPGWLDESRDMGELPRATFPELWTFALVSGNLLDDVSWLAEVANHGACGAFSTGNGSTTFRIPLRRRTYTRARDPQTGDLEVGQYQKDAQQNITGMFVLSAGSARAAGSWTGPFSFADGADMSIIASSSAISNANNISFDASRQIRTADEVRPVTIVRLPIIKAFDTVVNAANIEVGGLVTQLGITNDRIAVSQQVMHVQDQKAYNVHGGTFVEGTWVVRDLNSIVTNTIPGASLTNVVIALAQ